MGGLYTDQFENEADFRAHFHTTGPEIWKAVKQQIEKPVDAWVMAAGTGGTLSGVSQYLKTKNPNVKTFLIDPQGSALFMKITQGVLYAPEQSEQRIKRNRYDTITEGIGIGRLTHNFA